MKTIGLSSDHAGYELKEFAKQVLDKKGIPYIDYGAQSAESSDYPDFAHSLAYALERGDVDAGIAACATGNGIAITLNKHMPIRAALCWNAEIAALARAHNDANILVMPGKFITKEEATKAIEAFLNTTFEEGRHRRRIDKIPF